MPVMKKINFHPSALQVLYIVIYVLLFALIVAVPKLISGPVHITEKLILEEEIFEGALLGILFFLNIFILNLYRKESSRQREMINKINNDKIIVKERLDDSTRYIGQLNVQIQEIKSIFNNINKLPLTKNDFKKTLQYFSNRVFGIANTGWVLFRIININTLKTISEQFESKHGLTFDYPHISNKMIIEKQPISSYTAVISSPQNLNIFTSCILPTDKISNDEQVFIQAITNEITMLYVIMNSSNFNSVKKEIDKLNIDREKNEPILFDPK
jgi:hypothetical protein